MDLNDTTCHDRVFIKTGYLYDQLIVYYISIFLKKT